LGGSEISYQSLTVTNFSIAGSFDWPHLVLTNASAESPTAPLRQSRVDLTNQWFQRIAAIAGPFAKPLVTAVVLLPGLSLSVNFDVQSRNSAMRVLFRWLISPVPPEPRAVACQLVGHQQAIQRFQLELSAGSSQCQAKALLQTARANRSSSGFVISADQPEPVLDLRQPVADLAPAAWRRWHSWRFSASPIE